MYAPNLYRHFAHIAGQHADETALRFADADVSYKQLLEQAEAAAAGLASLGITAGDVVCLCVEKSSHVYATILGCLRLGAPYVMLDPESPLERLCRILDRCEPELVVVGGNAAVPGLDQALAKRGIRAPLLEELPVYDMKTDAIPEPSGANPAYIMFTSGSTGFPKGAVMTHANVLRLIAWSRDRFGFGPGDVLTNVNPLYFDNSVFDIYSSLFSGAALAPFTRAEVCSPAALVEGINARGCTSWFSVPSLLMFLDSMRALRAGAMKSLRRFVFGGEGYPLARLKKLFDAYGEQAEIVNVYGPTECTCICSAYTVTADDFDDLQGFPPLGSLTPEFTGVIVDEAHRPVPDGEAGELVLCGPCVGRGYYKDPERTAQAFQQNPLHENYHDPAYHTGDIVRLDPVDGKLGIAGRRDNQVKHMGYRIELEEIENALCAIEGVHQAAAVHGQRHGNSCLAAAVHADAGLDESALRRSLQEHIPAYMIPSEIHLFDELPKNANGKVDRPSIRDMLLPEKTII